MGSSDPRVAKIGQRHALRGYARLLKLKVPDLALFPLVSLSMLTSLKGEPLFWAMAPVFLIFGFCCQSIAIVLDDIQGYLDGVDRMATDTNKRNVNKPLVHGELTVGQASRAAKVLAAVAILLLVVIILTTRHPLVTLGVLILTASVPIQYSYGLKLSYHCLGELVIIYSATIATVLPYWCLTGLLPPTVVLTGVMTGLPFAALVVNSHILDYEADRKGNRHTLAVILGIRRVRWVSWGLLGLFWVLLLLGLHAAVLPLSCIGLLALLPAQARMVKLMLVEDYRVARLQGFRAFRWQILLMVVAFATANHLP